MPYNCRSTPSLMPATLAQVFFSEFCEILKINFIHRTHPVVVSVTMTHVPERKYRNCMSLKEQHPLVCRNIR